MRYSTSALGYLWSILDPLVMAGIYWFVFTQVFDRAGRRRAAVHRVPALGLLPWMWFNGAVSDSTRAFLKDAKLVRSTKLPRTIWVNRIVLPRASSSCCRCRCSHCSRSSSAPRWGWGCSVPARDRAAGVLTAASDWSSHRWSCSSATSNVREARPAVPLLRLPHRLRHEQPARAAALLGGVQPAHGIFGLYRAAFFPAELDWFAVGVAPGMSLAFLAIGLWVFRSSERQVLKEI